VLTAREEDTFEEYGVAISRARQKPNEYETLCKQYERS
jgi:hypothetical protein